nr:MAG TPA: hypothetical protein [Caudoviricetes sp.]
MLIIMCRNWMSHLLPEYHASHLIHRHRTV